MNGNSLVLDTNIVLYLLSGDQTIGEFLEGKQGYLSIITELELIGYPDIEEAEAGSDQGIFSWLQYCRDQQRNPELICASAKEIPAEIRRCSSGGNSCLFRYAFYERR